MQIAIDGLSCRSGGGINYFCHLVAALADIDSNNQYTLIIARDQDNLHFDLPPHFHWVRLRLPAMGSLARALWTQLVLPIFIRRRSIDLLFSTADITALRATCPVVLMVHNLKHAPSQRYQIESAKSRLVYLVKRYLCEWSIRKADRVIFVSEYSRQVLRSEFGIPEEKSLVIPHGLGDIFLRHCDSSRHMGNSMIVNSLPTPYLLTVASVSRHKNLITLVKAFAAVLRDYNIPHHLVIVGEVADQALFCELQEIAKDEGISDRVHYAGWVPYDCLSQLYTRADAFVFPSRLETFGIPLIEAMACCLPIAASNATAMPEICQDAAIYFDPFDPEDMANAIHAVLTDSEVRERLVERGLRRVPIFSWERTARRTLEVLIEAATGKE